MKTKPRCELKAYGYFVSQGLEAYVPLKVEFRQWSDRKKKVKTPAIASYVFVCQENLNYEQLNENPFTSCVVKNFGKPAKIKSSEINIMKRYLDGETFCEIEVQDFRKGQSVVVTSGKFMGKEGVVEEQQKNKVVILLEGLQLQLKLQIAPEAIAALS